MRAILPLFLSTSLATADFFFGAPVSTINSATLLNDVDDDGHLDAIEFAYFASTGWEVTWQPNDGNGEFFGPRTVIGNIGEFDPALGIVPEGLGNIEEADLNNDGLLDIVRWEINVPRIEAFFRDPTSTTGYGPLVTLMNNPGFLETKPKYPEFIEFPDLDGDGITDMVVGAAEAKIWTITGTGGGAFAAPVRVLDTTMDGLVVDDSTAPAKIYFGSITGTGGGILGRVADIDLMEVILTGFTVPPAAMELYDVGSDGRLDLIVGSEGGWYAGLPPGGDPWENIKQSFMTGLPVGVPKLQMRDIDLDGDKDLILSGLIDGSGDPASLIREDGGTTWATSLMLDWDAGGPMGDLDGDGKMDIVDGAFRHPFDPDIFVGFVGFVGFVDYTFGSGPHFAVTENGGLQPLAIELSTPLEDDLTLTIAVAPDAAAGTPAVEGSDYVHSGTMVVIPAGATTGEFTVRPLDNSDFEGSKHFTATITSNDNAVVTTMPASTTVTIEDDEYLIVVVDPVFALEDGGVAEVDWTVDTNASTVPAFNLSWETVELGVGFPPAPSVPGPYDAWEANDYTPVVDSLAVPAGVTSGTITIPIIDDSLSEFDESFGVEIVVNGDDFSPNFIFVTILDDEPFPSGYMFEILTEGYGGPDVDPMADPDGDGVENLIEYALGTFDSAPAAGERFGPSWMAPPGGAFGLGFCARSPTPDDVILTVVVSADLGVTDPWEIVARKVGPAGWTILDPSITLSSMPLPGGDTHCYHFRSSDWDFAGAGFVRLDVELVP